VNLPSSVLENLELELNKYSYESLPIGSALSQLFYIELFEGKGNFTFLSLLKDTIADFTYYRRKIKPQYGSRVFSLPKNSYLFSLISERKHLKEMVIPVADKFIDDEIIILAYSEKILASLSDRYKNTLTLESLSGINYMEWKHKHDELLPKWKKIIHTALKNLPLIQSNSIAARLLYHIKVQTILYESLKILLYDLQPKKIIVEYDREFSTSCLVSAGNHLNIDTVSLLHGVINYKNAYVPLIAKKIIVWGAQQKEILTSFGVPANRIVIDGAPQLSRIDTQTAIKNDKPVVLFASNPCKPDERKLLVNIFCQAVSRNNDIQGIVRIHPSEKLEFYQEQISQYNNIKFVNNALLSYTESILTPDIICVFNSAFSIDAIINDKPLIVINIPSNNNGNTIELIEKGKFLYANTAEELDKQIKLLVNNPSFIQNVLINQNNYRQNFILHWGATAAQKVYNTITE
jgi:hypothetical protein